MRILQVIQRYPPAIGGAEFFCQGLSRYLATQGYLVFVLTTNVYSEEEFWREPTPDKCILRFGSVEYDGKVKVLRCKRNKINYLLFLFFKNVEKFFKFYLYGPHSLELYLRLFREIKNFDIVHLYALPYPHNLIAMLVAKLFKKKTVITPFFHIGHPYYELYSNYLILKKCDKILVLSNSEKKHLIKKGIDKNKIYVIYNAIDPNDYKPKGLDDFKRCIFSRYNINEDTKIVIFIGRKVEYKGIDTLIEAVRLLRKDIPIKLFIIGPNFDWFNVYYNKLSEDEKQDIIDFGPLEHQTKVNLLHLSHLLVLPSKFESFGTVILEAWACRVVAICTTETACREIIDNDIAMFPYGDILCLKEKIELLFRNEHIYNTLLSEGIDKLNNYFTWDKVGKKVSNIYNNMIVNQ